MKTGKTVESFALSTAAYEEWLGGHLRIVPEDLERKHQLMREDLFAFFRATFYRWAQLFPAVCPGPAAALPVLAVGDLHIENFGTWRDSEGRLAWGINDFDEASYMPWTIDLIRLTTSACIAIDAEKLGLTHREAGRAILEGYRDGLDSGGRPWVLAGQHHWLNNMVRPGLRDPAVFWDKLGGLPRYEGRIPGKARRALDKLMPERGLEWQLAHRVAGLGSLGRQRFVALALFEGGMVCREAKALAPSAWDWAQGGVGKEVLYQAVLDRSVRAHDPYVRMRDGWIVRRLAPDCTRIELGMVPGERDEVRLLHAMGWEIANVHLGSAGVQKLTKQLTELPSGWLPKAARKMAAAVGADWRAWRTEARS